MFTLYDQDNAPQAALKTLATTQADFGMIPNLERTMAGAPALLSTYSHGWEVFNDTSLSAIEQQVVYQTANVENNCEYCVPWHTLLCQKAGMDKADIEALRAGADLTDAKLSALQTFTRKLLHNRGNVLQTDLDAFFAAGYGPQQAMEVVLGIAIKTMSNFTNSIAGTPLDKEVKHLAWEKPTIKPRS